MDSNNHSAQSAQGSSNLQTEPSVALPNNNNDINVQHTSINNIGMSMPIHTAPQNTTFEFYLPLPNDTRIYHVTYTEINSFETARRLNNNINLSHISDCQFPHHYNTQSLIQQQIYQRVQQPVVSQIYQPNSILDMVYPDDNIYNAASIPSNGSISDNTQDMGYDGVQTTPIQK